MNLSLLLTGNIAPQKVPFLKRMDFVQRENDYYEALQKWMEYDIPIVFCENSNFNSIKINKLFEVRPDCEYLKFETQKSILGKGNGEAEIFEFAFKNSKILKKANYICKVTGRYNIINFKAIQKKLKNSDFLISANMTDNLSWADSRFFIFQNSFYNLFLREALSTLNESNNICFEHCLARAIHKAMSQSFPFRLLPELPIYQGVYGGENIRYDNNWIRLVKNKIFSYCKKYFFESLI